MLLYCQVKEEEEEEESLFKADAVNEEASERGGGGGGFIDCLWMRRERGRVFSEQTNLHWAPDW
jgi:hypothetical protein